MVRLPLILSIFVLNVELISGSALGVKTSFFLADSEDCRPAKAYDIIVTMTEQALIPKIYMTGLLAFCLVIRRKAVSVVFYYPT